MIVDINYLQSIKKRLAKINAEDVEDLKWVKDGEEVKFSEDDLKLFSFMGLSNTHIIDVFNHKPVQ